MRKLKTSKMFKIEEKKGQWKVEGGFFIGQSFGRYIPIIDNKTSSFKNKSIIFFYSCVIVLLLYIVVALFGAYLWLLLQISV